MKAIDGVGTEDVMAVYDGALGAIFELVMGEHMHIGGPDSSIALAEAAGIGVDRRGVDLCCGNGAAMRFLVEALHVSTMVGVDRSATVIRRGQARARETGASDRIGFVLADARRSGLADASADFVWSEDAWVYVPDKAAVVAEAARIVRPGGVIAVTDWVEGQAGLSPDEAGPLLEAMTFPSIEDVDGYRGYPEAHECDVLIAERTDLFGPSMDEYAARIRTPLRDDALKLLGGDEDLLATVVAGFEGLGELGHAGSLAQARFVARRR